MKLTLTKTLRTALPLMAGAAALSSCCNSCDESSRPNFLFVFVDDLGYADVGFNGSTYFETPNIDAMANKSVIFENSYMYPTSSPSRTALFTGQQSFRTGVYTVPVLETVGDATDNIYSRWTITKDYPFYSEQLAKVGYKSIHLGKWHVVGPYPDEELSAEWPIQKQLTQPEPGDYSWVARHNEDEIKLNYYPEGRGFEKNVGGSFRGDPAYEEGGYKSYTGGYRAPFSNPFVEPEEGDEWLTDRLTDEAIDFMAEHKDGPFFINLHYYTVHRPVVSRSEELLAKYEAKPGDKVLGQGVGTGKKKTDIAAYASMIESLDDNFGRMIDFLDKSDLSKNTIVVFSSDNGYNVGANNLLRGKKRDIHEGGVRVPTFVYWPGKMTPRRTEVSISVLDYFPTFLDMAGINDYTGTLDGTSFKPLLMGDTQELYERPIYWQLSSRGPLYGTCTAVRQGKYKAIQYLATGDMELYDMDADPMEANNLVESDKALAEKFAKQMSAWRRANNVPMPGNSVVE